MSEQPDNVQEWEQLVLEPPRVVEIVLRYGWVPESDHCQFELQTIDATSGITLALASRPHLPSRDLVDALDRWLRDFRDAVLAATDPFPDL